MLFIGSSEPNGICYIETKNIDGETNLKHKQSVLDLHKYVKNDFDAINTRGVIISKPADDKIYSFSG